MKKPFEILVMEIKRMKKKRIPTTAGFNVLSRLKQFDGSQFLRRLCIRLIFAMEIQRFHRMSLYEETISNFHFTSRKEKGLWKSLEKKRVPTAASSENSIIWNWIRNSQIPRIVCIHLGFSSRWNSDDSIASLWTYLVHPMSLPLLQFLRDGTPMTPSLLSGRSTPHEFSGPAIAISSRWNSKDSTVCLCTYIEHTRKLAIVRLPVLV